MKDSKKLFLLDAYALIYRAYFAFIKNPRINSKAINTSAIFGFANSLFEVIKKESPTHLAVVFDTKKPTIRHIEYPDYKAHREEMPDGLRDALPYIDRLLEALNIPKLYKDGFEADDVIGTLAKKAEQEGFKIFMMTPDKDFAQLVSENIFIYRPGNKWQPTTTWGIQEVLDKFDIQYVQQVIDFLGMMGDASDNIPGIPGIGKKTAQKFIKEYGSMEGLFANTEQLKGKIKQKVESSQEIGLLSKKLATIITDVPIEFNEKEMEITAINQEKIQELFTELEFKNLLNRVPGREHLDQPKLKRKPERILKKPAQIDLFESAQEITKQAENDAKHINLQSEDEILLMIQEVDKQKQFGIHILSDTKNAFSTIIIGYAISIKNGYSYYIDHTEKNINLLKIIFENPEIKIIGFDLKFLIKILKRFNISIFGVLFDTQVAHYLLHPEMRHAVEILAENYLGIRLKQIEEIIGKGKSKLDLSSLSSENIFNYVTERSSIVFKLAEIFDKQLKEVNLKKLFTEIEMPLTLVLANMESEGITLDNNMLSKYSNELSKDLNHLILNIHELAGEKFNISSPKQMGDVLFEKMNLSEKPKKTKSGQYSTSEETLLKIKENHPIITKILEFRAIKKLLSTYVDALPEMISPLTNRIHTTFNQSVATTGRLSSVNPNLQNIPIRTKKGMKVREAFIPRDKDYTLLAADYSQIELRIMASLSQDDAMIKAFNEGVDIHSVTASKVYNVALSDIDREMRSNAKSVNFGIIYGISPFGLSQNIGVSRKYAKELIDQYFLEFPKIKTYMDASVNKAREFEYVETLMGRRRYLSEINSRNAVVRAVAERNAINAPIQGSAADIIKKAMIDIQKEIKERRMKSKMLLQVHDELVFDMHNSEKEELKLIVKNRMEGAVDLQVPLCVDIGEGFNWLEAH